MKKDETEFKHYTSEEILQILIDSYNCQVSFCGDAYTRHQLTFQTTIGEWRKICDLDKPVHLAEYLRGVFNMDTNQSDLINLLSSEDITTLGILCNYIADHSIKATITPAVSESLCLEVSIFKALKNELEKKGIDTTDFKPSANFAVFFLKYTEEIISIISKLSPGTLSYYKYKSTIMGKLSALLILSSIITPVAMVIFYHNITWHIIPLFVVTIIVKLISNKLESPNQYDISGYRTIRDLVIGMKKRTYINNSSVLDYKQSHN